MSDAVPDPLDNHDNADRIKARRQDGNVLTLIVDASRLGPDERNLLEQQFRDAAITIEGVEEVRIAMTSAKEEAPLLIAIGSGKGGVGKSTLTANIAVALAKAGRKVGLVDADIYGPSQPTLLGAKDRASAKDKQLQPVATKYGVPLLSVGQLVSEGHALAWRGPMAAGALQQLLDGDWSGTEMLLVDLPPGTGDVQLSLLQKARPAGAVIVSTPQDLSLIDATRAVDLFNKTAVPVLGLVENMASYTCPKCGEESEPFGQGGAEAGAKKLGIPFLGRLPLSLDIREASDAGVPPAAGDGPASERFAAIAKAILVELEKVRG